MPAIADPAAAPAATVRVQPTAAPAASERQPTKEKEKVQESASAPTAPQELSADADLERKAEEIKRRALSAAATSRYYQKPPSVHGAKNTTVYNAEEGTIDITFHKRKHGATASQVAAAMLLCILLIAGWKKGWSPINTSKNTVDAVAIPHTATDVATQATEASTTSTDTTVVQQVTETTNAAMAALPVINENKKTEGSKKKDTQAVALTKPIVKKLAGKDELKNDTETVVNSEVQALAEKETVKEPEVATAKEEVSDSPEKKKKLGQVIKNIFRKKDKGEKAGAEATEAGAPENQ